MGLGLGEASSRALGVLLVPYKYNSAMPARMFSFEHHPHCSCRTTHPHVSHTRRRSGNRRRLPAVGGAAGHTRETPNLNCTLLRF